VAAAPRARESRGPTGRGEASSKQHQQEEDERVSGPVEIHAARAKVRAATTSVRLAAVGQPREVRDALLQAALRLESVEDELTRCLNEARALLRLEATS